MSAGPKVHVLVIGASGLLGSALMTELSSHAMPATGTFCDNEQRDLVKLDLCNTDAIDRLLGELSPNLIINTVAETDVDLCEREVGKSYQVNVESVVNLARACREKGIRLVTFSSDYVFGAGEGPYDDSQTPAPLNAYGRHKFEAEQRVAEMLDDYLIVRTCNLYGYDQDGKNFVMGLLARLGVGDSIKVPLDQWGCPTLVSDLAAAVVAAASADLRGLIHMAGPDSMDRLSFARRVAELLGFGDVSIEGVKTVELGQAARRPLHGGLVISEVVANFGKCFRGIDEGVLQVRTDMEAAADLAD